MSDWIIKEVSRSVPFDDPDYDADNVHDAIIETKFNSGQARYALLFGYNGNASNRWLELFQSNPSDGTPFVIAEISEVVAMSLSNTDSSATATITLYKNGSPIDSLSVTSGKTATESGLSWPLAVGDELSAKVTSGSLSSPMFSANIKVVA